MTVLHRLMSAMYEVLSNQNNQAQLVDYAQLNAGTIAQQLQRWVGPIEAPGLERIARRLQVNAKHPDQVFVPDVKQKQGAFADEQRALIDHRLMPVYESLHRIQSWFPTLN